MAATVALAMPMPEQDTHVPDPKEPVVQQEMTNDTTLGRLREYFVGPSRFMTLLSCFELGVIDALRERGSLTAQELGRRCGANPDNLGQLLLLMEKEGFVGLDPSSLRYSLGSFASLSQEELRAVRAELDMIKLVSLRQLFHLTESVRRGAPVGLTELYGHDGNLYELLSAAPELRAAWAGLMNSVTARVDPWFFAQIDIPAGSRVLDLAGNTGLGAVHTLEHAGNADVEVTTFDLPEKEQECLETFRAHGVEDRCSFIGGDVFEAVPAGHDVILVKHFLPMFDEPAVRDILANIYKASAPGTAVHVLAPVVPEDVTDPQNYTVDFYPSFFIGCAMGSGGPRKLSTWTSWLEESGFEITGTALDDPGNAPAQTLTYEAVISARRAI